MVTNSYHEILTYIYMYHYIKVKSHFVKYKDQDGGEASWLPIDVIKCSHVVRSRLKEQDGGEASLFPANIKAFLLQLLTIA